MYNCCVDKLLIFVCNFIFFVLFFNVYFLVVFNNFLFVLVLCFVVCINKLFKIYNFFIEMEENDGYSCVNLIYLSFLIVMKIIDFFFLI